MKLIEYMPGILGIFLLLFFLVYALSTGNFDLRLLNILIVSIGISLCLAGFLPERTRNSLINYPLSIVIDKIVSKYGTLFLGFLILTGFYFRFNNLGNLSFWIDEVSTTFASIGILQQGYPILPSGVPYTRAIFNTSLIALSFKIFGISEFSARIISVIFGTLVIFLIYLVGARVANKRVGLLAALIITFSLWEIVMSREARMYVQFQFFYLLTAYLFYIGLEKNNFKVLLLSAVAFIFSYLLHVSILSFLPVAAIYILSYKKEVVRNIYFIYGSLVVIGLTLLYLVFWGKSFFENIVLNAPLWGQASFYYYALAPNIDILFLLLIGMSVPLLFLKNELIINKNNSYLLLNFFISLILLSISAWKSLRYAFYIFPFLVLSISYIIDLYLFRNDAVEDIYILLSNKFKLRKELTRTFTISFIIIILLLMQITLSIGSYDASQKKDEAVFTGGIVHSNWKKAGEFVKSRLNDTDIVISTRPEAALFYAGRSNYQVRSSELYSHFANSKGQLVETYAGSIILTNYSSFINVLENNDRGWIIVEYTFNGYNTDPAVRKYVRNNMTYHSNGSDSSIQVYSWNKKK